MPKSQDLFEEMLDNKITYEDIFVIRYWSLTTLRSVLVQDPVVLCLFFSLKPLSFFLFPQISCVIRRGFVAQILSRTSTDFPIISKKKLYY